MFKIPPPLLSVSLAALILFQAQTFADETTARLNAIAQKLQLLEQEINERKQKTGSKLRSYKQKTIKSPQEPPVPQITIDIPSPIAEQNAPKATDREPSSVSSIKTTENDWYQSKDFDFAEDPLNQLSVSLAVSIPSDLSTSGGTDLSFESGIDIGFEYSRYFSDSSYVGGGFSYKSFGGTGHRPTSTPSSTTIESFDVDSSMFALFGTLGQHWSISSSLSLLTQASAGFSRSNYETTSIEILHVSTGLPITIDNPDPSGNSFYYSLLIGLQVQWNQSWHSALYYELDGRSAVEDLDYQNFYQIGVRTGFGF